jgi:alpha-ketoglutarate-dependent taurine dioxygenase
MVPCDARARETAEYFEKQFDGASEYVWDDPEKILVIANRKVLHARSSAANNLDRELQRISYYLPQEVS